VLRQLRGLARAGLARHDDARVPLDQEEQLSAEARGGSSSIGGGAGVRRGRGGGVADDGLVGRRLLRPALSPRAVTLLPVAPSGKVDPEGRARGRAELTMVVHRSVSDSLALCDQ